MFFFILSELAATDFARNFLKQSMVLLEKKNIFEISSYHVYVALPHSPFYLFFYFITFFANCSIFNDKNDQIDFWYMEKKLFAFETDCVIYSFKISYLTNCVLSIHGLWLTLNNFFLQRQQHFKLCCKKQEEEKLNKNCTQFCLPVLVVICILFFFAEVMKFFCKQCQYCLNIRFVKYIHTYIFFLLIQ